MMFREIIPVCYEAHKQQIKCVGKVESFQISVKVMHVFPIGRFHKEWISILGAFKCNTKLESLVFHIKNVLQSWDF